MEVPDAYQEMAGIDKRYAQTHGKSSQTRRSDLHVIGSNWEG
jgi:hypothetical protein